MISAKNPAYAYNKFEFFDSLIEVSSYLDVIESYLPTKLSN